MSLYLPFLGAGDPCMKRGFAANTMLNPLKSGVAARDECVSTTILVAGHMEGNDMEHDQ